MAYNFDPELHEYLAMLPPRPPGDDAPAVDLATARQYADQMMAPANAAADVSQLTIDDRHVPGMTLLSGTRSAGAPDVPVRVYQPAHRLGSVGGVLYIHGGGFTVGSVEMEHANAVRLANELGVVVTSVEYRLAPEHPYPAAIDDCYAALCWMHAHSSALGIDATRIATLGNSAGGGLNAGLNLLARDRGGPQICFQFLGIPEIVDRLETPSMQQFVDTPMWTRAAAEQSWRRYLGDLYGGDVPAYAAPSRATDLSGLPPTYVSTMQYDPLRDEGIIYALRLLQAGVSVELHSYPNTFHGSAAVTTAAVTKRQFAEMTLALRRVIATPG